MKFLAVLLSLLFGFRLIAAGEFSTDIDKTFSTAKKEKKLLLINFFGIWCPPCNELEETVFETPAFHAKARAFKLLNVDADDKKSWKLKDRYKVGGYPTVVFTNSSGDEIYRLVGYRALPDFLKVMDLVLAAKGKEVTKSCKSENTDDLWRCALVCSERKDKICADAAYKKLETRLQPGTARYEEARTYAVENSGTEDLKRAGYEELLSEFNLGPKSIEWAVEYVRIGGEGKLAPKKALIEKVLAAYPRIVADPNLDQFGISPTDLPELRGELLAFTGKSEEAKASWKEAASLLEKTAAGTEARGFTLERITCLEEAGEVDAAVKLANEYRQKYPKEFTFYFVAASVLERAKKYNEAIPLAKQAYALSYGDNRIRVATLLVKLYNTVPDKNAAKQIYEEITHETKPEDSLEIRTHKYLQQLRAAYQ